MRLLVVLAVLMASVIGLGWYVEWGIAQEVDRVLAVLERGEQLVNHADYAQAEAVFQQALAQWRQAQGKWNPFVYNTSLEEIEVALARVASCAEVRYLTQLSVELSHLRARLAQVKAQERLLLKNIL